jgi:SM-20-related protein
MSETDATQHLLPPHSVYRGFLDSQARAELLAWAIENQEKFEPSKVYGGRSDRRKSLRVRNFKPMETLLRQRVLDLFPTLIRDLRMPHFELSEMTTELVAHNDGAFFKRHSDRIYGAKRGGHRVLSAVYYFHAEPKAFSGGALRLYSIGGEKDESSYVDVWPEQNTLLAFPSLASHEVLPISCPSGRFADSRFAVNFWLNRRVGTLPPLAT